MAERMQTIWKATVDFYTNGPLNEILAPPDAGFLPTARFLGNGQLEVWFRFQDPGLDEDVPLEPKRIQIVGTGHPTPLEGWTYVTTVFDGSFVWHLFAGD